MANLVTSLWVLSPSGWTTEEKLQEMVSVAWDLDRNITSEGNILGKAPRGETSKRSMDTEVIPAWGGKSLEMTYRGPWEAWKLCVLSPTPRGQESFTGQSWITKGKNKLWKAPMQCSGWMNGKWLWSHGEHFLFLGPDHIGSVKIRGAPISWLCFCCFPIKG